MLDKMHMIITVHDLKLRSSSYSANNRLLAISLLDCTVKVFFADTLKVGVSS